MTMPTVITRRTSLVLLVVAILFIALTFAQTLWFDFVNWDDDLFVTANPLLAAGAPLRDHLLTPHVGYPIPVTMASYQLEHALFGLSPTPYHATNIVLHLASAVLVYAIGRRLGLTSLGATAAMVLFGLHPVVAEPVSWVSGRKDILSTFFSLAATLAFIVTPFRARTPRAWFAPTLFLLAVFAKPGVALVPLFLAGWYYVSTGERPLRAILSTSPMLLTAAVATALSYFGLRAVGSVRADVPLAATLREVWYSLGYHLGLVFGAQEPLAKHIPLTRPPAFDPLVDLLPIAFLAFAFVSSRFALTRVRGERRPVAALGLLFAAVAYIPNSNIIPLQRFLSDSFVYLPLVGLAWAFGSIIDRLFASTTIPQPPSVPRHRPFAPYVAPLFVSALALFLSLVTLPVSARWRDGITLWAHVDSRYPDSPQVCRALGNAFNIAGRFDEALSKYNACAERFGPDLFARNIAVTLYSLGRIPEARAAFLRLASTTPTDPVVVKYLRLLGRPSDSAGTRNPTK